MQVSEIMHRGISAANINDSVKKVAELMRKEDIGAVPVMENNRPVGFVTDRDIVINCVASGYDLNKSISHAMTEKVVCIKQDEDVEEALRLMEENQISRVLVIDEKDSPVGMLSLQNLADIEDEDMEGEALSEIKKQ